MSDALSRSALKWSQLVRSVDAAGPIMRAEDIGHKMAVVGRILSLAEDIQAALEQEDEEP